MTPVPKKQFRQHDSVNFVSTATGKRAPFEFTLAGKVQTLLLKGRVSVTSATAYHVCCLQGLGFIQVPGYGMQRWIASHDLVEVLTRSPSPMPVSMLYPHRQLSPRLCFHRLGGRASRKGTALIMASFHD